MPTLVTNVTALGALLPSAYGGVYVAPTSSVTINDTPPNVQAEFAQSGQVLINWSFAYTQGVIAPGAFVLGQEILYVSPTGSASVIGNDPTQPTTLAAALALAASIPNANFILSGVAGNYGALPAYTRLAPGTRVTIQGPWIDSGGGVRTVGASPTTTSITDAGGLLAGANQGRRLRFTSGANAGQVLTIQSNTTTANVSRLALLAAPAPGDTFVVEMPGMVVSPPSGGTFYLNRALFDLTDGALLTLNTLRVLYTTSAQRVNFLGGSARLVGVECDFGTFAGTFNFENCRAVIGSQVSGVFSPSQAKLNDVTLNNGTFDPGCYFHAVAAGSTAFVTWGGCTLVVYNSVFQTTSLQATYAVAQLSTNTFVGGGTTNYILLDEGSSGAVSGNAFTAAPGGALKVRDSFAYVLNNTFATSTVDCIVVNRGDVWCDTNTGDAGGTGVGVRLTMGAQLRNDGGNTITGTAGNVQIGGNTAVTAWGSIANPTTDFAATTPQYCLAHTTATA